MSRRDPLFPNALIVARREYRDRVRSPFFVVSTILLMALALGVAHRPDRHPLRRPPDRDPDRRRGRRRPPRVAGRRPSPTACSTSRRPAPTRRPGRSRSRSSARSTARPRTPSSSRARSAGSCASRACRPASSAVTFRTDGSAGRRAQPAHRASRRSASGSTTGRPRCRRTRSWARSRPRPSRSTRRTRPTDGGKPIDPQEVASRAFLGIVFVVLLFLTVIIYGMWVATGVATEKSSRVMELMISAASPRQMLTGKVVGIGGAGLTQYLADRGPGAARARRSRTRSPTGSSARTGRPGRRSSA